MSVPESLRQLAGTWAGTSRLFRPWMSPVESDSESTASIAFAAADQTLTLTYTWTVDGTPQEGLLALTQHPESRAVKVVWTDSWHMSHDFMTSQGIASGSEEVSVLGSYAAPPGPDWGWRTEIRAQGPDAFELVMYNITPQHEEHLAFSNRYRRLSRVSIAA